MDPIYAHWIVLLVMYLGQDRVDWRETERPIRVETKVHQAYESHSLNCGFIL